LEAFDPKEHKKKKGLGTKIKELFTGNPEEEALEHEKEVIRKE